MRHAIRKTLKWTLLFVLLLLVLALGGVAYVAGTQSGLRWAWNTAEPYLPEGIAVAKIEGRLIGPLAVDGLQVNTEGMRLSLGKLRLNWAPAALLRGRLHIRELNLAQLQYLGLPTAHPEEPQEPFALPESIDLPVDVRIDALNLNNASIQTAPGARAFVIDNLHLLARTNRENWLIRELRASGPQFEIKGGALLTPRGAYASDAKLDWTLRLPELAPIEGETTLQGNLGRMQVHLTLAAPYNLEAHLTLHELLGDLALNAKLVLANTRLAAIKPDLPSVTLDADINANGGLDDLAYQLDLKARDPEFGTALLAGNGRYTGQSVVLEKLVLSSPDTPGRLTANGHVGLTEGYPLDLDLRWQKLQWPLAGAPEYRSPQGQFTLTGKLQDYRLQGALDWAVAGAQQAGTLSLDGHGNAESFTLETLAVRGAPGTLNGTARIAWAPALKLRAELRGHNVNSGAIVAGWPGALDLQLRASAARQPAGLFVQLEQLEVQGRLRKQPLQLDAQARYGPEASVIEQLRLVAGQTRLQAQGQLVQDKLDFSWSLKSDDLATTVPGARGQLDGSGRVDGSPDAPVIRAQINGRDLGYHADSIEQFNLAADIDAGGARVSTLELTAQNGNLAGQRIKGLQLTGSGTPDAHQLELDVDSSDGQAQIELRGTLSDAFERWQFVLQQARLSYRELAPWTLAAPAEGLVSAEAQRIEHACWRSGDAELCLQGENAAGKTQGRFSLENLAFAYLQPLLPPDMWIDGALSGSGSAALAGGGPPEANVQLTTTAGSLGTRDAQGEPVEALAFAPGQVQVRLTSGLQVDVDLPLATGGGINLDASVPAGAAPLGERPLSGNLNILLEDLSALPALIPQVGRAEGEIRGDLALGGSLGKPQIEGRLSLLAPVMVLDGPGLELKDVDASVIGRGRQIGLQLKASSGGGSLNAEGEVQLADTGATVNLKVLGDKFKLLDTRDARVWVSPDLTISVTPERIDVNGRVAIPKADITPKNLPASNAAVTVSDDQVIVQPGNETQDVELGRELHARVRLVVGDPDARVSDFADRGRNYADVVRRIPGDKVRFQGFGLKAIFAGNLLVTQAPGEPALGSGELRIVVGEYKAYGQDLSIQNGRVLFAGGPVSEPALDVRAVRRPAEGILVGVRVRGPLQQPDFTLFSEPGGMTQSEQLSWLVLGRALGEASAAQSSLVTRAALALGSKGGNALARNLGERVGLDEIGIESDGADAAQAAFVVGKYLTPKLYISYGIGLFEPVSTVRLRYILSPRWQVETQSSGATTGGDIIYSIERGGD